jgi:hypothetical protein
LAVQTSDRALGRSAQQEAVPGDLMKTELPPNVDLLLTTWRGVGANVRCMISAQTIDVVVAGTIGKGIAQVLARFRKVLGISDAKSGLGPP